MKNILLIFFLTLITHLCSAQKFDQAKLDSYFDVLETDNRFMGSVAVSRNDSLIYRRAIGFADAERKLKATQITKYRIGAISKTFTAAMVLQGVEAKKIDLYQTIGEYFPNFPMGDTITIKHLLHHRSGIHDFTKDKNYANWSKDPRTPRDMVRIIAKGGIDFEPGTKGEYSNSNYVLLSYILESAFKMPYSEALTEYITKPLGLANTYFGRQINVDDREAHSYRWAGDWEMVSETDMFVPMGAGGIISTPSDLVRFSDALFGGRIIKESNVNRMQIIDDELGMGLFKYPFNKESGYGHSGSIDGFNSVFMHFANGNISYALTSNGTNFKTNDVTIAVLSAVFKKSYEVPQFKTIQLSSEDLDKYLGVYNSTDVPLEITITRTDSTLIAQASGQPSFPLEPKDKNVFTFASTGMIMEFDPVKKTILLRQDGGRYFFRIKK